MLSQREVQQAEAAAQTEIEEAYRKALQGPDPDPETLDEEFVEIVVTKRVKRAKLLEAIKQGRSIPGVSLANGGRHLVIKPT